MGLQGKGFEVWRASLRLGGVLEERVTACRGVANCRHMYVERSLFWNMSVSPACHQRVAPPPPPPPPRVACAMIIHASPTPQLDPL